MPVLLTLGPRNPVRMLGWSTGVPELDQKRLNVTSEFGMVRRPVGGRMLWPRQIQVYLVDLCVAVRFSLRACIYASVAVRCDSDGLRDAICESRTRCPFEWQVQGRPAFSKGGRRVYGKFAYRLHRGLRGRRPISSGACC